MVNAVGLPAVATCGSVRPMGCMLAGIEGAGNDLPEHGLRLAVLLGQEGSKDEGSQRPARWEAKAISHLERNQLEPVVSSIPTTGQPGIPQRMDRGSVR